MAHTPRYCAFTYILDLHMTPYGVMLHECEFVAENIHRKLTEYHKMNVSPLHGILSSVFCL